jgi:hypothetical protein
VQQFVAIFTTVVLSVAGYFGWHGAQKLSDLPVLPPAPVETASDTVSQIPVTMPVAGNTTTLTSVSVSASTTVNVQTAPKNTNALSQAQLLSMASDAYADGSVPLGDDHYVTDAPKKGYVYLCNVHKDNPGSMVNGPWMHGTTWNLLQKVSVDGSVKWPNATFSDAISGMWRILSGNGLPVGYTTGVFPVASTDDAHQFDANPNTIKAQTLSQKFPASPTYSDTPYCMGGEVGVMTDGVPLFNAFDAGLRDAPAHELQDSCDGHPQGSGEYHYHSLSSCFKDIMVSTVLGYALDGFPITGPEVAPGKFLTTDDLDVCHGITSDVKIDGKTVTTYHYVMTRDFPYSASCFRGKPVGKQVIQGTGGPQPQNQMGQSGQPGQMQTNQSSQASGPPMGAQGSNGAPAGGPPQAAIDACTGNTVGVCTFSDDHGSHTGFCQTLPDGQKACVPH